MKKAVIHMPSGGRAFIWCSLVAAGRLSLEAVRRLIIRAGAERVGDSAAKELRKRLEEIGEQIGRKSVAFASHAGRTTVKGEDVRLASREIIRY
jgi:histone H3/H4